MPSDVLLAHGSVRVVYGVALARNFREYLLGLESEPDYLMPLENPTAATQAIGDWWAERWLTRRIQRGDVFAELAKHKLTYPERYGARVIVPDREQHRSLFNDKETVVGDPGI